MSVKKDEKFQKSVYKDEKTQKDLNKPLDTPESMSEKDQEFLDLVIRLINEGEIDLYKPESLINNEIYDDLSEDKQGKIDIEAVNLLSALREIKGLFDANLSGTYQMNNLVERVRNTKERLEEISGDIFII